MLAECLEDRGGPVQLARRAVGLCDDVLEGVTPVRGAEDGAAEVGDVLHRRALEQDEAAVGVILGVQEAVIALPDPEDLPPDRPRGVDGGVDHGIQPRGVAAAGVDRDSLDVGIHGNSLRPSGPPSSVPLPRRRSATRHEDARLPPIRVTRFVKPLASP
jgi:hypothetical protein